ncbi:MAG: recombinase family protein [Ruminococcus sp.]
MKILESEVYTGDLVQGKTKIVDHQQVKAGEDNLIIAKCTHEPIISYELFNAVQEYRKQICEESKATPKRPYTPNIFKGKVFCADCGRSLHRQRAERRKGPDTYWFHCLTNSRIEKDSCKGATMQEKELISTVTDILEKELTVALGMSLPLFQLEARQKQEKDKLKIQMSAKRQEIEKTRRLIRGLYENFVQGILTNDEYFELKADYEHAINALSGEIEVFEKSMDSPDNQLARYRAMEKDAKTLAQDHVLTAELIERLIERIEIDHERNIHVTFRFKNEFQGKGGGTVRNYVIALYIRLSVEDFKTESLSIPNQKLILREKAMSLPEWDNSEILEFIDNGHTGTNFERPAVQELLTMVQAGKINCIIVKDLSRFGRNSIETGYFIERVFPLYHTRFISVSDDFDTANFKGDTGGIDIAFKYLISECYSRDMSMKTKSAKYAKMRRGEYQSVICPYGYRKSADGRMEPDEDVAPNVQMIFQWASEGNTAAEITRKLYAMNIPTPGEYRKLKGKDYYNVSRTNGVWSTSTVLRILEDQRYIGTYVIGKRKVKEIGSRHTQLKDESEWFKIPNHHPAIVSVDLFEKANASIKRFSLSNKKPRDYLLRGKVFCGCCDHAMSLRNGAWFYCRHSEVAETLPCHGVRIKMADLEQVVFETIRAQMCPALGIDSNKDKLDLQTVQQAEHEEKLRSIQDSKRHLYEQYALGEIDLETYRTRKAVYDTELVQAKNVHAVITAQTKQIKSDYEIKLKQQEIVQEVGNANMLTKALIDRLINKVYVFPGDRIEIEYATQDFLETKAI